MTDKASPGALRAAKITYDAVGIKLLHQPFTEIELAQIIDRETGAADMLEALEKIATMKIEYCSLPASWDGEKLRAPAVEFFAKHEAKS